jgi:lysozyme
MQRLIEQLKRHEGVKTHAYDDTAVEIDNPGKITIGVGRNIDPRGGLGLSMEEIEYLLSNDITRCMRELKTEYSWFGDLDDARAEAITNVFLNLGATRFRQFKKAIAAMSVGNYDLAATEFLDSLWARQVGNRALELTDIIKTGEYANV